MPLLVHAHQRSSDVGTRWLAGIIGVIVVAFVVATAWSAADRGSLGQSHAGCVTVTIPSTTGGALLHGCGARARAMCQHAFRHEDRLSQLIRPACRLAGLS